MHVIPYPRVPVSRASVQQSCIHLLKGISPRGRVIGTHENGSPKQFAMIPRLLSEPVLWDAYIRCEGRCPKECLYIRPSLDETLHVVSSDAKG